MHIDELRKQLKTIIGQLHTIGDGLKLQVVEFKVARNFQNNKIIKTHCPIISIKQSDKFCLRKGLII